MDDEEEIRSLITDHFEGMRWGSGIEPDWDRFGQDFLPEAVLFGAARPVTARFLNEFIERMETVARSNLRSFEEHTRGMKILRFGNVAVVLAISKLLENGADVSHDISAYLLVKSDGRWSIAAHAWDQVREDNQVPLDLQ